MLQLVPLLACFTKIKLVERNKKDGKNVVEQNNFPCTPEVFYSKIIKTLIAESEKKGTESWYTITC